MVNDKLVDIQRAQKATRFSSLVTDALGNIAPHHGVVDTVRQHNDQPHVYTQYRTHELVGMLEDNAVNLIIEFENDPRKITPMGVNPLALNTIGPGGVGSYTHAMLAKSYGRLFDDPQLDDLAHELLAIGKDVVGSGVGYYENVERNNELTGFDVRQTAVDGIKFTTTTSTPFFGIRTRQRVGPAVNALFDRIVVMNTCAKPKLLNAYAQARVKLDATGELAKLDTTLKLENFLKPYAYKFALVDSDYVVVNLERGDAFCVLKVIDGLPVYIGTTSENCLVQGVGAQRLREATGVIRKEVNKTLTVLDLLNM